MQFNQQPGESRKSSFESKLTLEERLDQRDPHLKIAVVRENPKIGEVTMQEFFSFDPENQGDNSCAATAFITLFPSEGRFTKGQLIQELSVEETIDDEETEKTFMKGSENAIARATATVDNLIKSGFFEVRNGRMYLNMEIVRGR